MKRIAIIILFSFAVFMSKAQVANYIFSEVSVPFQPLDTYSAASVASHTVMDDVVIPARVQIPFAFNFAGKAIDSLNVHENGFIWFGNITAQQIGIIYPISNPAHPLSKGFISAIGNDLHPQYHTNLTTEVNTGVIGNTPSRVFVIEWLNTSRFSSVWDYSEDDTLNFQIRLHETSGIIDVCFGKWGINTDNRTYAEVGLKTAWYDFNSRKGNNVPWTQTQTATALSERLTLKGANKPSSGQVFRWTPPNAVTSIIKQSKGKALKIFPSPVEDRIYIGEESDTRIWDNYVIYDPFGKTVQSGVLRENFIAISFEKGAYILELTNKEEVIRQKFIKQ